MASANLHLYEVELTGPRGHSYGVKPWIVAKSIPSASTKAIRWARKETTEKLRVTSVNRRGSVEAI